MRGGPYRGDGVPVCGSRTPRTPGPDGIEARARMALGGSSFRGSTSGHPASSSRKKQDSSGALDAKRAELTCSECGETFEGWRGRLICSPRCKDRRFKRLHPEQARAKQRRKDARRRARGMTERELQAAVIERAQLLGWRVAHVHAVGFPNLVVLVRERIVFVKPKGTRGKVSEEQRAWLEALEAGGAEVYVWKAPHWHDGSIEAVLQQQAAA